ncbi:hypothetical protein NHX12_028005 [Muraenolepis orangiensis]|uniref:NR LBD domain-containing protein n=1 Tax=Muraenolepis orangiensis TaxID=630683 RepID=A0A9Q0EDA0_9TELE|nr:hypothetical protein NHX12_028005 [Muraenolepis orangiensis]
MRGGRNKFGPMYRRHRALKKHALLQSHALNVVPSSPRTPLTFSHTSTITTTITTTDLHQQPHCSGSSFFQTQTRSESQHHYHASPLGALSSDASIPAAAAAAAAAAAGDRYGFSGTGEAHFSGTGEAHFSGTGEAHFSGTGEAHFSGSFYPPGSPLPRLLVDFLGCELDELQVQRKIIGRLQQLQEAAGWHGESLMYLLVDQMLFFIVEWARESVFFKELKVDLPEVVTPAGPLLRALVQKGQELVEGFRKLLVDRHEIVCFKFLILFNTDVKHLENQSLVENVKAQAHSALLQYTLCAYPQLPDKFHQLLLCLSDLQALSTLAEEYLDSKDICGEVPGNNLLNELLHAKHHSM